MGGSVAEQAATLAGEVHVIERERDALREEVERLHGLLEIESDDPLTGVMFAGEQLILALAEAAKEKPDTAFARKCAAWAEVTQYPVNEAKRVLGTRP